MVGMSYAIPGRTATRWAPSFARWRTPHIYILRLVPCLTGARPLENQVMSYHTLRGPCLTKVVLPILTTAHAGRAPSCKMADCARLFTTPHGGTAAPVVTGQRRGLLPLLNSKFVGGFCPHFWGSARLCHTGLCPTNVRLCPTDPQGGTPAGRHLPKWRTAN